MEECKKADEEEKFIVKKMLKYMNNYFNNEDDHCPNQQLIGCKDMFRSAIKKDWVMENSDSVNFLPHDKVLIEHCVKHYHGCWKGRCIALHNLDV